VLSSIRENEGDDFLVLLNHRNTWNEAFSEYGADLVLCGHAHGGIIRLPFIGGIVSTDFTLFPKYTSGIYKMDGGYMLVSRGLGNSARSFRVFNNPIS
jgi:predicted MPP superfamily phosphohydrolase